MRTIFLLPALMAILVMACEHQASTSLQDRFEPIQEDFSAITDPRARWQAYLLHDYVLEQQWFCFCGSTPKEVVVENNQVAVVIGPKGELLQTELGMTVDQIFAWIDTLQQQQVNQLEVDYHSRFGYPTRLQVDRSFQTVDDEFTMYITSLRKSRK